MLSPRDDMIAEIKKVTQALMDKDAGSGGYYWKNLVPELTKLAEKGNGEAALEAGRLLSHGFDITPNYSEAIRLLELAVQTGVLEARVPLIYCVLQNDPVLGKYADMFKDVVGVDPTSPKYL